MSQILRITLFLLTPALLHAQDAFSIPSFGLGGGGSDSLEVVATAVPVDANTVDINVTVTPPANSYIYSTTTPFGTPTGINIKSDGFKAVGAIKADHKPKVVNDPVIGETMEKYYGHVTFTVRVKKTSGTLTAAEVITGELTGQYCTDDGVCIPIRPPAAFQAVLPEVLDVSPAAAEDSGFDDVVSSDVPESQAVVEVVPDMRPPKGMDAPPVRFKVSLSPENPKGGDLVKLSVAAQLTDPFHIYSITQPPSEFGPKATQIKLTQVAGLEPVPPGFVADHRPEIKDSGLPDTPPSEIHHDQVVWSRDFTLSGDAAVVEGEITFQVCNENSCLPTEQVTFRVATAGASNSTPAATSPADGIADFGNSGGDAGMAAFIFAAVSAGFLALLTPCVFPMIPVTVSYFLKQGEERPGSTLKLAVIYCAGIVGAFTVLGLLMAVLLGPASLSQLATNPWLNLGFAIVFTIFALMLMGMFEITVPSFVVTWTSKNQQSGGLVGVLFMALTFTLVSFTCTFAFVGSILVAAAQGSYLRPVIGMLAFSAAFASPFFLLALFPSMLKKLPKSGGWMNSVKVTLGLLELAIVTKFLSVADTGFSPTGTPQFLDFQLVMGSWIAVAVVTGMYLLNVFRLPGDSETKTVGPLRCMFSVGFFGLAAYIAVGVFSANSPEGALWQQIVAFGPAQIDVAESEEGYVVEHDGLEYLLDFDEAVATASSTDTLMFLDFTGVDCQNCRLMEERVLPKEFVKDAISDLVRVQLYTDKIPGVKANPELHEKLLARNHELQDRWFGTTAIPAYAIVTPDGKQILSRFVGLDRSGNSEEFRAFLNAGLEKGNNVSATAIAKAPETAAAETTMARPAARTTSAIQSASFVVE